MLPLLALVTHQASLNHFVRSGQFTHDTVQVLTDKFLDTEKAATGRKAN